MPRPDTIASAPRCGRRFRPSSAARRAAPRSLQRRRRPPRTAQSREASTRQAHCGGGDAGGASAQGCGGRLPGLCRTAATRALATHVRLLGRERTA
eukprot:6955901-Prymnesium_polylepis.1